MVRDLYCIVCGKFGVSALFFSCIQCASVDCKSTGDCPNKIFLQGCFCMTVDACGFRLNSVQ